MAYMKFFQVFSFLVSKFSNLSNIQQNACTILHEGIAIFKNKIAKLSGVHGAAIKETYLTIP